MKLLTLSIATLLLGGLSCSGETSVAGSNSKASEKKAAPKTVESNDQDDDDDTAGSGSPTKAKTKDAPADVVTGPVSTANPNVWSAAAVESSFAVGADSLLKQVSAVDTVLDDFVYILITDAASPSAATGTPRVVPDTGDCDAYLVPLTCEKLGAATDASRFCFHTQQPGACRITFVGEDGNVAGNVAVKIIGAAPPPPPDPVVVAPPAAAPTAPAPAPAPAPPAAPTCNVGGTVGWIFPTGASSEADAKAKATLIQDPPDGCARMKCREVSRQINWCDDSQSGAIGDGSYLCATQFTCQP